MPPAISDEETLVVEMAPASVKRSTRDKTSPANQVPDVKPDEEEEEPAEDNEEDEEDEEVGEDGEELYVVEKILSHRMEKDGLKFKIKWEGYEKKSDRTWEPEENLSQCPDLLEEYYRRFGGKEQMLAEITNGLKGKKRGRQSTKEDTPTSAAKKARQNSEHPRNGSPPETAEGAEWRPPLGSWENEVAGLDAGEDEETGKLIVFLTWKNGKTTQHDTSAVYKRCPQKMLQFYERHVKMRGPRSRGPEDAVERNGNAANGDADV